MDTTMLNTFIGQHASYLTLTQNPALNNFKGQLTFEIVVVAVVVSVQVVVAVEFQTLDVHCYLSLINLDLCKDTTDFVRDSAFVVVAVDLDTFVKSLSKNLNNKTSIDLSTNK